MIGFSLLWKLQHGDITKTRFDMWIKAKFNIKDYSFFFFFEQPGERISKDVWKALGEPSFKLKVAFWLKL